VGQSDLPLASGTEHRKAFERLGWKYVRTAKNAHFILSKDGSACKLSIPDHKQVKRALLQKQLRLAEISEEQYLASFRKDADLDAEPA
jgi:hypothetical protein